VFCISDLLPEGTKPICSSNPSDSTGPARRGGRLWIGSDVILLSRPQILGARFGWHWVHPRNPRNWTVKHCESQKNNLLGSFKSSEQIWVYSGANSRLWAFDMKHPIFWDPNFESFS